MRPEVGDGRPITGNDELSNAACQRWIGTRRPDVELRAVPDHRTEAAPDEQNGGLRGPRVLDKRRRLHSRKDVFERLNE